MKLAEVCYTCALLLQQSFLVYSLLPQYRELDSEKTLCNLGCDCPPEGQSVIFLDCGRKDIVQLPSRIQFHPDLTSITFHGNRISNISMGTFYSASRIQELDLSLNSLTTIAEFSFRPFSDLDTLRLSQNNLSAVPAGLLEGLANLRVFEMGHNNLRELPPDLFEPTSELREVRLQHNKLTALQENSFHFLPLLEKLDLENNRLDVVPCKLFVPNSHLQWLSLADNSFERVPGEALKQARSLSSLNLSGNKFIKLQSGDFSALRNISLLYLNNLQHLVKIEKNAFANLGNLKMLSCSYNKKLSFIHPEAFGGNMSTSRRPPSQKLFLRYNALRSLPKPSSEGEPFTGLAYVDLRDNPWRCDCNLKWMTKLNKEIISAVRCETPLLLHGRSISTINEDEMICNSHWVLSTVVLVVSSIVAFVVCIGTALTVICTRTSLGVYLRAKGQFAYIKVVPKSECVDLEWDPSAEM